MLTGNAYGGFNAVWDTVTRCVLPARLMKRKRTATGPRATPEEIAALGHGAFLPCSTFCSDFVIVTGTDLVQTTLAVSKALTMLDRTLRVSALRIARMSALAPTATTRRGISAMFPNTRNGRPSGNCVSADAPPGLIQVSLTRPDAASGWGPAL